MHKESVLIIAGEMSGEEIALGFVDELQGRYPEIKLFGVGGDSLKSKGMDLLYHLKDFSSWGISGVITKIPFYYKAMDLIVNETQKRSVKIAILIDFQTFNFKLAKKLHQQGVKVLFLVAPQAWAWKAWRGKEMAKWTEALFCLLPFEKEWFANKGVKNVFHMTHPMYSRYSNTLKLKKWKTFKELQKKCHLLLLPGSRKFEVKNLLPVFLQACKKLQEEGFCLEIGLLKSENLDQQFFDNIINAANIKMTTFESGEEAFSWGDISLACSGTITLTSALFEIPTVVCYKTSLLNQFIFETFVNYTGPISLANIMSCNSIEQSSKKIFPELIQDEVSLYNILMELSKILRNEENYDRIKSELQDYSLRMQGEKMDIISYFSDLVGKND